MGIASQKKMEKPPQNPVNGRAPTAKSCGTLLTSMASKKLKKPSQNTVKGRVTTAQKYNMI